MPIKSVFRIPSTNRLVSSDFIPKSQYDSGYLIANGFFDESEPSTYNLGYTTIGSVPLSGVTDSATLGSRFTASQSGNVTSIKVYTNIGASGTATLRVAIFANTGSDTIGSLIASSSPVNVTNTSPAWIDVPISASVTGGNDYWLFAWGDASGFSSDFTFYADANSDPNSIVTSFNNSYPNWSTVGDGVDENYDLGNLSIYAVVEVASSTTITESNDDTITLSDSIAIQLLKILPDNITLSDANQKQLSKSLSDSITLSDSYTILKAITQSVSDTITLSDSMIMAYSKVINDTITLTESVSKSLSIIKTDTITITDVNSKRVNKLLTDSLTLTDNLIKSIRKAISDTITLSDSYTSQLATFIELNDSISLSDTYNKSALINIADNLNLTDSLQTAFSLIYNDDLTLTDSYIRYYSIVLSDNINTSDLLVVSYDSEESSFIIYQLIQGESNFIIANPIKESNFVIDYQMNQANFTIKTPVIGESNFIIWQL